jgi:hypothetical protein
MERIAMARVRLTTDPGLTRGCGRIGSAHDDSVKDLRRKIVKMGGNTALITFGGSEDLSMVYAEVFRCAGPPAAAPGTAPVGIPAPPPGPPPPPPPPAPASPARVHAIHTTGATRAAATAPGPLTTAPRPLAAGPASPGRA